MRSSNPVLSRLGQAAQAERTTAYPSSYPQAGYPQAGYPQAGYQQPGYQQAPGYPPPYQPYPSVVSPGGASARAMTIDDVVTRTVLLIVLTAAAAALSWVGLRGGALLGLFMAGSVIAGLVLGLVISFRRITNPVIISIYAILQGVLLGVVSRVFEEAYGGIVIQAVAATFGVFFGMAALYRFKVLRATPKFTRFVIGALFGIVALSLINWIVAMFGGNLGLVYYSPTAKPGAIAILFSLGAIVVGALTFILDLDAIDQGIRYGLPEKYAWYCAFGLLVGLIFLYWQILRLLGYLRR